LGSKLRSSKPGHLVIVIYLCKVGSIALADDWNAGYRKRFLPTARDSSPSTRNPPRLNPKGTPFCNLKTAGKILVASPHQGLRLDDHIDGHEAMLYF
jgi:hypothetical protein